ncbi:MAG: IPT/TIG domain-containing protein [Spirochaetaceae bacterium]|jgi:transglutaminase-like putative cysteine protease|nr:IPT/TIG domain-containing protein [Spirochaetaceae bacterium]
MTASNYKSSAFIPMISLVLCVLGGFGLTACEEPPPFISSISPRLGIPGELLIISGKNFGESQDKSYVTIAQIFPTMSSYIAWTDTEITLRLPEFGESAMVYIQRGNKKSNPALISNRTGLPQPVPGAGWDKSPRIGSLEPGTAVIGALVVIQGSNFGSVRDTGGVFFTREKNPASPDTAPFWAEVFDTESGYELWSDREIQVRVPDGAASGNLEVRTPQGNSGHVFFQIIDKPGTKFFGDKQNYTLSYTVDLLAKETPAPHFLYLWCPRPVLSSSQPLVELLSWTRAPFMENYRGTTLFKFNELSPNTSMEITLSFRLEVYAVTTAVRESQIKPGGAFPVETVYTLPSPLIPSDHEQVKALANTIIGRERNPYQKARRIYNWLVTQGGIQWEGLAGGVAEALAQKRTDPYGAALLFCALARAGGIPALPVSGVLVEESQKTSRHYWAEFWIDGFGWVPLDPALGAGAAPAGFTLREDREAYYFGNMDNRHIAFSRGEKVLSQMEVRGKTVVREREFALQNIWEESSGGLDYASQWGAVRIDSPPL